MELRSGKVVSNVSKKKRFLNNSLSAMMMKGEELSMPLPEELVERILAMVPFPQIFKARALSKSWKARLSSISSLDDEEKKFLALSFQKRVCEWSEKWNTSYPGYLFDDFLIAYDRASQRWRQIPTLSFLPARAVMKVVKAHKFRASWFTPCVVGALLFITTAPYDIMFVVNIFTGSCKELPALPSMDVELGTPLRLVCSKEMYKVVTLYGANGCVGAWIYDSKLGAWRTKTIDVREALQHFDLGLYDENINGVIYAIVKLKQVVWGFLAFDVEEETFTLLQMPSNDSLNSESLEFPVFVACNGTLYMSVGEKPETVVLLEADLASRRWSKLISGPPAALNFGSFAGYPFSDGACLFFSGVRRHGIRYNGKILAYNVRKDEWSYFTTDKISKRWFHSKMPFRLEASFQPGSNPFLEV